MFQGFGKGCFFASKLDIGELGLMLLFEGFRVEYMSRVMFILGYLFFLGCWRYY